MPVARAIVNNPAVLIADEPTGNLDPHTAWEIMDLLDQINLRGTTIVMVTHAKDIVDQMQKRVIAIEKGRFGQRFCRTIRLRERRGAGLSSLLYNIKQGFLQIFRNRGMSLASIFSILAMLLILGLFFVITVDVNLFTEVVKQDYDQVEVFLLDDTSKADAEKLMEQISAQPGVTEVQYRGKARST